MKATKPIGVHVPESDYNALRSAANERHISIAALILRAVARQNSGLYTVRCCYAASKSLCCATVAILQQRGNERGLDTKTRRPAIGALRGEEDQEMIGSALV